MSSHLSPRVIPLILALAAASLVYRTASAGPPLICHPLEIGEATSLPWGNSAFEKAAKYDDRAVIDDAIRILDTSDSALVHMETLRRATLYIHRDRAQATELLARLMARTLDAEAGGMGSGKAREKDISLAWFDAGYLAQCYDQMGVDLGLACGSAQGVTGYAWVARAVEQQPGDPELQFGAAMMTVLAGLPDEAVDHHHEAILAGQVAHVADRHDGVLELRRKHRQVIVVQRPQLKPAGGDTGMRVGPAHRYPRMRSISAPQAASFASSCS